MPIKAGSMLIKDWRVSSENLYRRLVYNDEVCGVFLGSIWLERKSENWTVSFSMKLEGGILQEAWQPQSFTSVEQAQAAIDHFLLRLPQLLAFA